MDRSSLVQALAIGATIAMTGLTVAANEAAAREGYVTAHSRFGNGSVTAPVREARAGYQVRLPGGSWVYCRRSCSETLRVETVDLFETNGSLSGYGTRLNECGVFGCLDIHFPR